MQTEESAMKWLEQTASMERRTKMQFVTDIATGTLIFPTIGIAHRSDNTITHCRLCRLPWLLQSPTRPARTQNTYIADGFTDALPIIIIIDVVSVR